MTPAQGGKPYRSPRLLSSYSSVITMREPVASTLIKLADFYGVTIDFLVGRTDEEA